MAEDHGITLNTIARLSQQATNSVVLMRKALPLIVKQKAVFTLCTCYTGKGVEPGTLGANERILLQMPEGSKETHFKVQVLPPLDRQHLYVASTNLVRHVVV